MPMYNVESVKESSHGVSISVSWEWKDVPHQEQRTFRNMEQARNYIEREKRTAILHQLERWVNHKRIIIERGTSSTRIDKAAQLERAIKLVDFLQDKGLHAIVKILIRNRSILDDILPAPANNSFQSSVQRLEDMIAWCTTELAEFKKQ